MSAKLRRAAPVTCMSLALIAVAAISGSAQARTAADPSPGVAGIDRAPQFTGLAASFLTRPSAVRGTDGRFHIAYELDADERDVQFAVDVERVEVRDGQTHRVLLSLAGRALSSRMNPVAGAPAGGEATRYDAARSFRLGGRLVRRPSATQGGRARTSCSISS